MIIIAHWRRNIPTNIKFEANTHGDDGRVAKIMNRIPIMCEMNEKYFNIAKERIDSIVDEVEE